jgi:hypothetical protein
MVHKYRAVAGNASQSKSIREEAVHAMLFATEAAVYGANGGGSRQDAINCANELVLLFRGTEPSTALVVIAIQRAIVAGNDQAALIGLAKLAAL